MTGRHTSGGTPHWNFSIIPPRLYLIVDWQCWARSPCSSACSRVFSFLGLCSLRSWMTVLRHSPAFTNSSGHKNKLYFSFHWLKRNQKKRPLTTAQGVENAFAQILFLNSVFNSRVCDYILVWDYSFRMIIWRKCCKLLSGQKIFSDNIKIPSTSRRGRLKHSEQQMISVQLTTPSGTLEKSIDGRRLTKNGNKFLFCPFYDNSFLCITLM